MRYLLVLSCLLLVGCPKVNIDWKGRILPDKGKVEVKQETTEEKTIKTDVTITIDPYKEPRVAERPPVKMDIMGEKITVPPNASIVLTIRSDREKKEYDWYSIIGEYNVSNKQAALAMIGALCMAAGLVLVFYGMWKMGAAAAGFGLMLMACGVVAEKYPWVFLIVLLAILGVVGYMIYCFVVSRNKELTLGKLVGQVEVMKRAHPDLVKEHITDPMARSKHAKTLRTHTRAAKEE